MKAIEWKGDHVRLLDQRKLPHEERYIDAVVPHEVALAIRTMAIRGAPILGIAAGFGVALAGVRSAAPGPRGVWRDMERAANRLIGSRPTAVNIAWAAERVLTSARAALDEGVEAVRAAAVDEALTIAHEDEEACLAIGRLGAAFVPDEANVLTHCNTGALATGGSGTALGVIAAAHEAGKRVHVWVGESRPVLQGARLTTWELQRLAIPMTLVADTAPGTLMAQGLVDLILVGADRIAANGDVANKVGTYQLAVLARHHHIPFYVAAPVSTIDLKTSTGGDVVIEERDPAEVTAPLGVSFAAPGTAAANPAFDITPASLITAIITDRGVRRSQASR